MNRRRLIIVLFIIAVALNTFTLYMVLSHRPRDVGVTGEDIDVSGLVAECGKREGGQPIVIRDESGHVLAIMCGHIDIEKDKERPDL